MALLVIKDEAGRSHLIHSSQIGPNETIPMRSIMKWAAVWERFDIVNNMTWKQVARLHYAEGMDHRRANCHARAIYCFSLSLMTISRYATPRQRRMANALLKKMGLR